MRVSAYAAVSLLLVNAIGRGDDAVSFNRQIRPILSESCFRCHGPDARSRKADLRLDLREAAVVAAIVPGEADASELIERITTHDDTLRMPPPGAGKPLTTAQIDLLRRWIASGAEYEPHWSFVPVRRPALSPVSNAGWPRNPIDSFILARLEQQNLQPAPVADRTTLLRRLALDLTGLPPTPEDADAFLQDERPDACERLVARLLANPHFGERWGRHWLDQARYADSNGYAPDGERTMWPYREWVIRAFNADLPFDQFTIEQLAGDLLPDPTLEQLVATGFHRNTLVNTEGGTKPDQFRVEQTKDRVDTTGLVWLGLTVGCANCHDHKYDPLKQTEYYQLYAFFDSTQDQNSVTPTVKYPTVEQGQRLAQLERELAIARERLGQPDPTLEERRTAWARSLPRDAAAPIEWHICEARATSQHGATFTRLEDGSLLVSGENRRDDHYLITCTVPIGTLRSLRLEALQHDSLPTSGPGRTGNGNFVLSDLHLVDAEEREHQFSEAWADHSQPSFAVAGAIDGNPKTGWAINNAPEGGANHARVAEFVLSKPMPVDAGKPWKLLLQFHNGGSAYNLGRFRLSASDAVSEHPPSIVERRKLAAILELPPDKRTRQQADELIQAFDRQDAVRGPLLAAVGAAQQAQQNFEKTIPTAMVLRELPQPRETRVHVRGDFLRPGDVVSPGVPEFLPRLGHANSTGTEQSSVHRTRLDFARWLVRHDNPLTARVYVNRVWMHLFGRGLVETENDFGTQGSWPTHPDLLDWLADEFMHSGWSTKHLIATIVESATYRQSSQHRSDSEQSDPRNLLLARQNRVRVEAEIVRDIGLATSGLLVDTIGGPSVYPPQPAGVYAFTQVQKSWKTNTDADRFRRGLYTFFYRSAPHPMLTTFDVPSFDQTCTRRDRSNTPLQSLTVANDEAQLEMTRALARMAMQNRSMNDADRIVALFRQCLTRSPTLAERDFLNEFLQQQRQHFTGRPADAAAVAKGHSTVQAVEVAAWTATARVLLNLDEFITRE